ncbi:MAG: SDR family oxidoreductase [bacterium]|nr:SDR family oxidoreductase [bacterium]
MNLSNKIILVTGGSSGIGESIVYKLVEYSAKVIFTYNSSKDNAKKISNKTGALALKCNISNEQECNNVVNKILKKHGRIDVLVNNAGIYDGAEIDNPRFLEVWEKVMKINLNGSIYFIRAVTPIMKKQKSGRIINISSIHSVEGVAEGMAYHASKAALDAVTRVAAIELASYNINVNSIAPGAIKTPIWDDTDEKEKFEIINRIPLKRFGNSDEIAGPVVFLASDLSNYITGQTIFVDGGILINVF